MKKMGSAAVLSMVILLSCSKKESVQPTAVAPAASAFIDYTIQAGKQFCDQNTYTPLSITSLKFVVKFDSSAIYQTLNPSNQGDVNKLYGFSDNNAFHQDFSARFGWRWYHDKLSLQGYIYNNSVRDFQDLATVDIGKEYTCAINVKDSLYEFVINGAVTRMPRKSTTPTAVGYKLYPYFGGDELAPHLIHIFIKPL